MTRLKVTYIAMDADGNRPIMSADNFDDLKRGVDEYYVVDKTDTICTGFVNYETKYPDDYMGHWGYICKTTTHGIETTYVDAIKVYCIEFYPETKYEI
jgi:hypothetical protein